MKSRESRKENAGRLVRASEEVGHGSRRDCNRSKAAALTLQAQEPTEEGGPECGDVGLPTGCGNMCQRIKCSVRQKLMPMGITWWVTHS